MIFCQQCGSLLLPKNGVMTCETCSTTQADTILSDQTKKSEDLDVMDKKAMDTLPVIKEHCDKCGNEEAFTWIIQTRPADEPETIFFKCTKCSHIWRSDSHW